MQSRDLQGRWCPHVKGDVDTPLGEDFEHQREQVVRFTLGRQGRDRCRRAVAVSRRSRVASPRSTTKGAACSSGSARTRGTSPATGTRRADAPLPAVPLRRAHAVVRPGEYEIVRSRVPSEAFRVLEQPDVFRAVLRHQPHPAADPAEHRRSRVPSRGVRTSHAWAPGRIRPPPHRHPRRARVPAPSGHTVPARAGPRLHARREAARTGTGTPSRFTGDRRSAANGAARRAAAARGPGRAGGTPRVGTRSPLGGRQRIPGGRRAARQGEGNPLAGPMITGYGPRARTGGSGRWGT